jgi:hypothetical protein
MDASGEFALCDSCGMKHTRDRIKAMAQEVTGTVAVSNLAGIESLMKRGHLALEDFKWKEADGFFNKVLDIDAEYAPAYIGKLCSELEFINETMFSKRSRPLLTNWPNYQKALRFAREEYLSKVKNYDRFSRDFLTKSKQRFENIQKQVAKEQTAILPQNGTVCVSGKNHTITLTVDGKVEGKGCNTEWDLAGSGHRYGYYGSDWYRLLYDYNGKYRLKKDELYTLSDCSDWFPYSPHYSEHIIAIASGDYHAVLLKSNGTVVAYGRNNHKQCETGDWHDIVAISAADDYTIGLVEDGTIIAAGNYPRNITQWKDTVMIYASGEYVVCLKSDDTFIVAGQGFNLSGSEEQIIIKLKLEQEKKEREELERREAQEKKEREELERREAQEKKEREELERREAQEKKEQEELQRKAEEEKIAKNKRKLFLGAFLGGIIGGLVFVFAAASVIFSVIVVIFVGLCLLGVDYGDDKEQHRGGCVIPILTIAIIAIIVNLPSNIPFTTSIAIGVGLGVLIGLFTSWYSRNK